MRANIIDVSNWQGNVNFDNLKKAGIAGVYNKATENSYQDPTYPINREKAKKHGIAFGGYLFLHPKNDAAVQVHQFLSYAKPAFRDLRPAIDIEALDGLTMAAAANATWAAVKTFRANGINPVVYGSPAFLNPMAKVVPALRTVDVWEANYAPSPMAVPYRVLLWQFADNYIIGAGKFDGDVMMVRDLGVLKIGGPKPRPVAKAWRIIQRLIKGRWVTDVAPPA